ncbi:MAG TPA: rod-binding protein [Terracidiphilus sp.]|nr:rod-binding protein [Terracidiphilus sp.]
MGTSMSPVSLAAQSSLLQAREDRMLGQMQSLKSGGDAGGKIEKGAMEFESMLLSTWLQQAEQSMATVPGAEDDEDAAGRDQMMSMGVQSLANSMAASGGIGIAKMVAKAMHAQVDKAAVKTSTTGESAGIK